MYRHITASGNVTVLASPSSNAEISVNTGFTGTITVTDGTATVAVITNPSTGQKFNYRDFGTNVQVNPSATCDLTVFANTGRRL